MKPLNKISGGVYPLFSNLIKEKLTNVLDVLSVNHFKKKKKINILTIFSNFHKINIKIFMGPAIAYESKIAYMFS